MVNLETLEDLPLLTIMVGLQGSGKSTKAKEISERDNAVVLSSDNIRKEHPDWKNNTVFEYLYKEMNNYLKDGKDVIIDATNTTIKSRAQVFYNLKTDCIKKCLIMNTPFDICKQRVIERNKKDEHFVPLEVLDNYLKSFEIPFMEEGWDYIEILNHPEDKESIEYQKELMLIAKTFDQHNKHHTKNLFNHMQDVGKKVEELTYRVRDDKKSMNRILSLSGYYHDVGKLFTQTWKENDENAHYYNHANVGAYYLLCRCGIYIYDSLFEDDDIIQYDENATLDWLFYINYHMHMYNLNSEKSINKWKNIFGEVKYHNLEILNQADKGEH